MFEQDVSTDDKSGKNRIMIITVVVVALLVTTGALLYRNFISHSQAPAPQPGLTGAARAGSPDYDSYAKEVAITNKEFFYATNALGGRQIIAKARVQNFGNRTIKGLEVRCVAVDFDGKAISERLAAPIPRATKDPLQPNGTLPISVVIDNAPEEYMVQDIKLELHGLILQ